MYMTSSSTDVIKMMWFKKSFKKSDQNHKQIGL